MKLNGTIKEKIARVIGNYFTTDEIGFAFADAGIPIERSFFAKWQMALDAFNRMPDPEESAPNILTILTDFCHPLKFQGQQIREQFVKDLNAILAYEDLKIEITDRTAKVVSEDPFFFIASGAATKAKTATDDILNAVNFFKDEYNKVGIPGLSYDYFLGEHLPPEYEDYVYDARLKAIERLKDAGFITEYKIEARDEGSAIYGYAICKIDESKITQKEVPLATEAKVRELVQKIEITAMPEVQVRNIEDNTLARGKKRIRLPKFKPTDWAKITIRFLDERNVLITADKKELVPADYETLGFADEKRGKPNLAWVFFHGLAQNNGETRPLPTPIPDSIKQQKRQLSDRLKTIFKNDTAPFYDPTDTRVYKIKINLIPPQFKGEETDELGVREHLKETMTEKYEREYENNDE